MIKSASIAAASRSNDRILTVLRQAMANTVDVLIIPSEDPHQSEYRAEHHQRREYVSGFTGSAGTAVVTANKALLWTDGRYFDQANRELSPSWQLMKQGEKNVPTLHEWLASNLSPDSFLGVDPNVTSINAYKQLTDVNMGQIIHTDPNLVDCIWENRPPIPITVITRLAMKHAGVDAQEKVQKIKDYLAEERADAMVFSALDEIAWLLNLRGHDIPYNPVFFAFAVVSVKKDGSALFVDRCKLTDELVVYLERIGFHIRPYEQFLDDLHARSSETIVLDPEQSSQAVLNALTPGCRVVQRPSHAEELKAIKNPVELEGMRQCHIRDGVALVRFLAWLDSVMQQPNTKISEIDASDRLEMYRREGEHFQGLSFPTISGSGANGAIIHYSADRTSERILSTADMYLVDSGAQYLDGTTDVTRTVHFGVPTAEERDRFTRVLIGHIRLAKTTFPGGTSGHQLDVLAREPLWSVGLNFNHGTGHGVGSFLCVHEGPHGISPFLRRMAIATISLKPGMTVTNEPGYYEPGKFGIRIESVMLVKPVDTVHSFGSSGWFGFETVTIAPIQTSLIDVDLLLSDELDWLNSYHQECLDKLGPLLSQHDPAAREWLEESCRPLS